MTNKKLNIQDMIFKLEQSWASRGCMIMPSYDVEKGAGTMSPYTFLRAVGPELWAACYAESSRRPADGRYGDNPNWLSQHRQFQAVIKPVPIDIQQYYLDSLHVSGIEPLEHDIRSVGDNWENPPIGCTGVGREVWFDGMEISQFTYFQVAGELGAKPTMSKITHGVERLASYIQDVNSVLDLEWGNGILYRDISKESEYEYSRYASEESNQEELLQFFDTYEVTAKELFSKNLVHPAYDYISKCSYTFNLLDARGAVSATERAGYLARIRNMAHEAAQCFVEERERRGFPLLKSAEVEKAKSEND